MEHARRLTMLVGLSVAALALAAPVPGQRVGVEWSTFFGGSGWDSSSLYHGVTTLANGDVILVGGTMSTDFPTTRGAYQRKHGGSKGLNIGDAFIARVRGDGSSIIWSTFFGGSADDMATAVAVDPNGVVTICGWTNSTDLPITSRAFQKKFGGMTGQGPGETFVARFDPRLADGAQLIWSTYLGSKGNDIAFDLAVRANGTVAVGGWTESALFPMRGSPFQSRLRGPRDFFVADFSADGSTLTASTFLGGGSNEELYSLALDSAGHPVVCGRTQSTDAPLTSNAFQSSYGGGFRDTYIAKLDAGLRRLLYATYLGGSGLDGGNTLELGFGGKIVVHGWTTSRDHPVTPGAYQSKHKGGGVDSVDAVVSMLDPTLSRANQLLWSTFWGGSTGAEYPNGLVVSRSGLVTVCGTTGSGDLPVTPGAFDTSFGGGFWDGFVTRFDPSKRGSEQLVYSTFVGDSSVDIAYAITGTVDGGIVVTGRTDTTTFPTLKPIQPKLAGSFDSYLTVLDMHPDGIGKFGKATPACAAPLYLTVSGMPKAGTTGFAVRANEAPARAQGVLLIGRRNTVGTGVRNVTIHVDLSFPIHSVLSPADAAGAAVTAIPLPATLPRGLRATVQHLFLGSGACAPFQATNAIEITVR